jgi:hypothetical protein
MATISDCRAVYGLSAVGTPTSTNVSGTVTIGLAQTQIRLADANKAYSVRAISLAGSSFVLDPSDNDTTGTTAFTAGNAQVETATAVGTISASGNASVVVTGAAIAGSPVTLSVPVLSGDTAAVWAGKVRDAITADAAISDVYSVSGASTSVVLTKLPFETYTVPGGTLNVYLSNDATLNVSLDNGTCTGITTAATSANTAPGVASAGVKLYDDTTDFTGDTVATSTAILGILIEVQNTTVTVTGSTSHLWEYSGGTIALIVCDNGINQDDTYTFTNPSQTADITVTVIGA